MATDAIITLKTLHCTRESDGSGHSEPYIWPVLLFVDDNTLNTPNLIGVTAPAIGNARVVIKDGIRAGETADIPTSVRTLRVRFEDGLSIRRLILAVALWEEDETPEKAMRAGYQAFSSELRAAVADNLFVLSQATEEQVEELTRTIKARVKGKVESAIKDGLTGWQKTRVFIGTLNLDDIINSDFKNMTELVSGPITLNFVEGTSQEYQIQGNLQMQPVAVDPCKAEADAARAAQSVVNGIDGQIRQLQTELRSASPAEKRFIISEIRRIRADELPAAIKRLESARRALQRCRDRLAPGGGVITQDE